MPNRKPQRQSAARVKTLLLPMARKEASALILRTRLNLERLRSGETDRSLINHLLQICLIASFVTRAGYGQLAIDQLDRVERELGELLVEFDDTGSCECRDTQMEGITQVVNEYDRMLGAVRLEIFARASDHLDRLMAAAANEEPPSTNPRKSSASPR
ncbi:hypothetical protein [Paraburkholderia tagetis]|uniref:Fis family transcriptional regulator n=1 Tax=Paraburkholderia tagetis TaxID=2913261 RepID=A0A9X1UL77_9BURK|nr:hypothetical protein [Paraburkholderia tagetis]MCG5077429.1 hypothetical protein [Paraburkholderia tagetis]